MSSNDTGCQMDTTRPPSKARLLGAFLLAIASAMFLATAVHSRVVSPIWLSSDEGWLWSVGTAWRPINHPPLFFYVTTFFRKLGCEPYFGRWLSVTMAVGTIAVVFWVLRELAGTWAGFFAAAMLASSVHFIKISTVTRGYVMSGFLGALSLALLMAAVRARGVRRSACIAASALGMCGAVLTEYQGLFYVPSWLCVWAAASSERGADVHESAISSAWIRSLALVVVVLGVGCAGVMLLIDMERTQWMAHYGDYTSGQRAGGLIGASERLLSWFSLYWLKGSPEYVLGAMLAVGLLRIGSLPRQAKFAALIVSFPIGIHFAGAALGYYPLGNMRYSGHLAIPVSCLCSLLLVREGRAASLLWCLAPLYGFLVNQSVLTQGLSGARALWERGPSYAEVIAAEPDIAHVFSGAGVVVMDCESASFLLPIVAQYEGRDDRRRILVGGRGASVWSMHGGPLVVELSSWRLFATPEDAYRTMKQIPGALRAAGITRTGPPRALIAGFGTNTVRTHAPRYELFARLTWPRKWMLVAEIRDEGS